MFPNHIRNNIKKLYSPRYLIITNAITGITSMTFGDCFQQYIEHKQNEDKTEGQNEFQHSKRRACESF